VSSTSFSKGLDKETVAKVETHLATAAAALGDAWNALAAAPKTSAVAGVGTDLAAAATADAVAAAKATVENVQAYVKQAAPEGGAAKNARVKALAASALGGVGLLVGVPYLPGITDNLLLGVLGAATGVSMFKGDATLDAETGPPVATERL